MDIFLYNPKSNNNKGEVLVDELILNWKNKDTKKVSYIGLDFKSFFESLNDDDRVIVTGGDGTLHYFVNDIKGLELKNDILFIPSGTGNDFSKDLEEKNVEVINEYITNLPTCSFDDKEVLFINGCGFGLDGYVCNLVNNSPKKGKGTFKKLTMKAFFKYKKSDLDVYIDGEKQTFKGVYLASIMNGRYEGGGMMMAPNAIRLDDKIEICLIYNISKLHLLFSFKKIYKGKHIKLKKQVKVLQGHTIKIVSEKGMYMQIDGEDFKDIKVLEAKK